MRILFTIVIFFILFGLTSCSKSDGTARCKDYEPQRFYKNLKDSTKLQIPFTGTDTLIYVSNYNDTAILYGQGIHNYISRIPALVSSDPDCPKYDYFYIENLDFEFKGDNPNLNFLFYRVNYPEILETREFITTYILNEYNRTRAAVTHYNYLPDYTSPVIIKGKTYYGIYLSGGRTPNFIYNKDYGFLQIKLNDTLTYTLTI